MAGPGFFDDAGNAVRAFSETALVNKLSRDPRVLAQISESLPDIARMDPQLAARVQAREPQAILEAYQLLARYDGVLPAAPANTGMIAYGTRGQGAPVGGPTGSGVTVPGPTGLSTQVTPRQRIPGPPQRRVGTTAGVPVGEVSATSSPRSATVPPRLESPDVVTDRRAMERLGDTVEADEVAERAARAEATRPGAAAERARKVAEDVIRRTSIPVAAGAAGIAAWNMLPEDGPTQAPAAEPPRRMVPNITSQPQAYSTPRPMVPDITAQPEPFSTADLAAETSPPPSVAMTVDYSEMARGKIREANEIQLREGRITPESAALTREADALYQRAADERRKGNHPPIMPVEQQNAQTSAIRRRAG